MCRKHTATGSKHTAKPLPCAAHGKQGTAARFMAKFSLPCAKCRGALPSGGPHGHLTSSSGRRRRELTGGPANSSLCRVLTHGKDKSLPCADTRQTHYQNASMNSAVVFAVCGTRQSRDQNARLSSWRPRVLFAVCGTRQRGICRVQHTAKR